MDCGLFNSYRFYFQTIKNLKLLKIKNRIRNYTYEIWI